MTRRRTKRPGFAWSVTADLADGSAASVRNVGEIDTLSVGGWLQIERLNQTDYFVQVGDARLCVAIDRTGKATVYVTEGAIVRGRKHDTLVGVPAVVGK